MYVLIETRWAMPPTLFSAVMPPTVTQQRHHNVSTLEVLHAACPSPRSPRANCSIQIYNDNFQMYRLGDMALYAHWQEVHGPWTVEHYPNSLAAAFLNATRWWRTHVLNLTENPQGLVMGYGSAGRHNQFLMKAIVSRFPRIPGEGGATMHMRVGDVLDAVDMSNASSWYDTICQGAIQGAQVNKEVQFSGTQAHDSRTNR